MTISFFLDSDDRGILLPKESSRRKLTAGLKISEKEGAMNIKKAAKSQIFFEVLNIFYVNLYKYKSFPALIDLIFKITEKRTLTKFSLHAIHIDFEEKDLFFIIIYSFLTFKNER